MCWANIVCFVEELSNYYIVADRQLQIMCNVSLFNQQQADFIIISGSEFNGDTFLLPKKSLLRSVLFGSQIAHQTKRTIIVILLKVEIPIDILDLILNIFDCVLFSLCSW